MSLPKTFDHPSFGSCELIPSIVAIKWARPLPPDAIDSNLTGYSLTLASEAPKFKEKSSGSTRDPRAVNINQSETLTWVSGTKLTDKVLTKLNAAENIDWGAPVYRAPKADRGPQSYFAINPTVLLLTQ